MYHRTLGDDDASHTTARVAESIRKVLMRAAVLMIILWMAPYLYGVLTGGRLEHLAGGDAATWETILWSLQIMTVFVIIGLMGVATCTRGMR